LSAATAFVTLDADKVLQLFDQVASQTHIGNCALVYNLDLLMARLTFQQRADVWDFIFDGPAYRRSSLLLAMPATAEFLLPSDYRLEELAAAGRLVLSENQA
jgi:hypothetical protein